MKKFYYILNLCLLITLSLVFISCGKNGEAKDKEEEDIVLIPVEVSKANSNDISAVLTATATLEAEEEAEVQPTLPEPVGATLDLGETVELPKLDKSIAVDEINCKIVEGPNNLEEVDELRTASNAG